MVNLVGLVIGTLVICAIGGGIGYLLWLKTRPKKETWYAKVYQLSEGVRQPQIKNGKVVGSFTLQDLRPYAVDVLEKVEKEKGIIVYRLQKLNKSTPAVESDVVEYWGEGKKEVSVLMHKGGCTLLKKGYDKGCGEAIFDPLPHSRINLIKSEMAIRKDRLQKEKDILQAITPWIVTGICMLGLVAIAYVQINGFIEISDNLKVASEQMASVATSYSLPTTQTVAVPVTKPRTAENANNDYASIPSIE
jgi:hypothetical protein